MNWIGTIYQYTGLCWKERDLARKVNAGRALFHGECVGKECIPGNSFRELVQFIGGVQGDGISAPREAARATEAKFV